MQVIRNKVRVFFYNASWNAQKFSIGTVIEEKILAKVRLLAATEKTLLARG